MYTKCKALCFNKIYNQYRVAQKIYQKKSLLLIIFFN